MKITTADNLMDGDSNGNILYRDNSFDDQNNLVLDMGKMGMGYTEQRLQQFNISSNEENSLENQM